MTTKNTSSKKTTTTKATATVTKPVATPEKSLATPKKETPEVATMSTDVFSKEMLTELDKRTKAIKNSICKIDSSFETIAFNLYWINSKEAYKAKGADSIAKYAADMFGYEKTTCYALIAVVARFAKRDDKGNILEQFDERYKGYGSSKLSLMVGLTDEQIQTALKPEMSVREIRKYINSLKEKPLSALPDGDAGTEDGDAGTDNGSNKKDIPIGTEPLCVFNSIEDYNAKLDRFDDIIKTLFKWYGADDGANRDVRIRVIIEHGGLSPLGGKGQFYIED